MGLSMEDYAPRWAELEAETRQKRKIEQVEKSLKQQQLRTLLVDPDWELYAQEIDKLLAIATSACEGLAKKLLEGDLDTFKKLMPDYRYNLGIKTAFEKALVIVKETQTT